MTFSFDLGNGFHSQNRPPRCTYKYINMYMICICVQIYSIHVYVYMYTVSCLNLYDMYTGFQATHKRQLKDQQNAMRDCNPGALKVPVLKTASSRSSRK